MADLYLLRPEFVVAHRLTAENRFDVANWPDFAAALYGEALAGTEDSYMRIDGPPGSNQLLVNDEPWAEGQWLIRDEHGAVFVMEDEVFHATFIEVDPNDTVQLDVETAEEDLEYYCEECLRTWDACECPEEEYDDDDDS